jgi:predicted rRNA methylase YqxC with S4 and FtsJ domains
MDAVNLSASLADATRPEFVVIEISFVSATSTLP